MLERDLFPRALRDGHAEGRDPLPAPAHRRSDVDEVQRRPAARFCTATRRATRHISRDVTERKRTEDQLRESNRRKDESIAVAPTTSPTRCRRSSGRPARTAASTTATAAGTSWSAPVAVLGRCRRMAPGAASRRPRVVLRLWMESVRTGTPFEMEYRLKFPGATTIAGIWAVRWRTGTTRATSLAGMRRAPTSTTARWRSRSSPEPGASPRRAGCLGHRDVPLGHRDERDRLRQEPGSAARSRIRRFRAIAPRVFPGGAPGRSRAGRRRLPAVRRTGSRFPGGVPRRLAGRYRSAGCSTRARPCWGRTDGPDRWRARAST